MKMLKIVEEKAAPIECVAYLLMHGAERSILTAVHACSTCLQSER
jgi:hypothetical protein